MTGTTRSSGNLAIRQRKALFRSWHRGMRELDLLLGTFADAAIETMSSAEIDEYERLLDVPDGQLLKWLMGEEPAPESIDTPLFRRIRAFGRVMPF